MYRRRESNFNVIIILAMIAVIVLAFFRGAFVSEDAAIKTLEAQGFSNITIVDHAWFAVGFRGCDEKDAARFTARVTNPAGKEATVYVCTGFLFKGGTIRVK